MNLDQAIGKLYTVLGKCRGMPEYLEAIQALGVIEEAYEALNKSQQMMQMTFSGDYDNDLHGVMLHTRIVENHKLLTP